MGPAPSRVGLGADAAPKSRARQLTARQRFVATGRRPERVLHALGGEHAGLVTVALDITDPAAATSAAEAAVDCFGRIGVLINNAADLYAGFFEELPDAQIRTQTETNLFGPMNVTRVPLARHAC
ncbi:SDR family NAD(P)-dependent oxidoreductase [Streptomyces sp. NBC_00459]|uniref:SDR family NAD(P)-dependent oxidoreductase n=1 Tax=Streptomyces sp. NBC_00459 TaxID=2975749 RepID=UPI002E16B6A2